MVFDALYFGTLPAGVSSILLFWAASGISLPKSVIISLSGKTDPLSIITIIPIRMIAVVNAPQVGCMSREWET